MFVIIFIILSLFFYYQNNAIQSTYYTKSSSKLPQEFDGFTICQISDLHNKKFPFQNKSLENKVRMMNPDIIVITGDLVDARRKNIRKALEAIDVLQGIAPLYYVSGNHEAKHGLYDKIVPELRKRGVIVHDNQSCVLKKDKQSLQILGIKDIRLAESTENPNVSLGMEEFLEQNVSLDMFSLLLAHRPEFFDVYFKYGVDLVLCGHEHGGQIRIPYLGPLVSHNQGLFPKYAQGIHHREKTSMIISRGLGNSIFPLRILNRPELVSVKLKKSVDVPLH